MTQTSLHPLLKRQLKLLAKRSPNGKFTSRDLMEVINQRYYDCDKAQRRLERSISVTSEELEALYEEAKQGKTEAEAANVSKSLFLANMSHEIRTPLNGVLGFTSLLLSTELSETQSEYLNIIQSSGKSLLILLNDILDLSKIEAGSIELEHTSFNLQKIIETCVDIFRGQLIDHEVDMNTYVDPALSLAYLGDPERLTQIITNFVSNALKFTTEGSVGIEVLKRPGYEFGRQPIQIRVTDTGIGISPEKQQAIFENFSQADLSTTREYGGTGLGLAISKHLSELMGGKISLESTLGEGSTFIFDLTLEEAGMGIGTILSGCDISGLEGKHVLVVDDTFINQRYFEAQLNDYGMTSKTTSGCDEALEYLSKTEKKVDVIITDHLMPNKDGIELIRKIRQRPDICDIPIILSSSSGTAQTKFPDAQYDAFVAKPVAQKKLLDKLNALLTNDGKNDVVQGGIKPSNAVTRILVAEDNYVSQRLIQQALNGLGYIIDVVADGQEAVRALKTLHYDLVLMDINMPIMGGIEAARRIRSLQNSGAKTPIIALTSNAMHGDKEKYLSAGMDDYLPKPVDIDTLKSIIIKWKDDDRAPEIVPDLCMSAYI